MTAPGTGRSMMWSHVPGFPWRGHSVMHVSPSAIVEYVHSSVVLAKSRLCWQISSGLCAECISYCRAVLSVCYLDDVYLSDAYLSYSLIMSACLVSRSLLPLSQGHVMDGFCTHTANTACCFSSNVEAPPDQLYRHRT